MITKETPAATSSVEDLEAFQELRSRASGKVGELSPDLMARHVLAVTSEADWPVQRSALDAIIRRRSFAKRDQLRVTSRPKGRIGLGLYATRRHRQKARPYRTLLSSVSPIVGSCDCMDFQKGALGLCKHLLVALEDLASKPTKWEAATRVGLSLAHQRSRMTWNPVRPLTGLGDWMERVSWVRAEAAGSARPDQLPEVVQQWFAQDGDNLWRLGNAAPRDPGTRQALLYHLKSLLERTEPAATIGNDPALGPLIDAELRRVGRVLDGTGLHEQMDAILASLKSSLYPYQRDGVARFLQTGRLLLADDMGLGKTVQAIAACHVLWRREEVQRGLLVVPAPLKPQWAREWSLFSDAPVRVVEGRPGERAAIYDEQTSGFLVTNYEQLLRDSALIHRWAPDMMVLDEAQRIKNWATKTAGYVKRLHPRYRLVLTDTPMENRLDELASIMDWVDERALEPKWRLGPWHATLCDGKQEVAGARNLDTLRTRLSETMERRVRREVLDQLPSRTDTRIPVELTPEQQSEHADLDQPIAALISRSHSRPLTQPEFLRLMQLLTTQRIICNGLAQLNFNDVWPTLEEMERPRETVLKGLNSPKIIELRQLIRNLVLEGGHKVVVFSQWRRMLRLAHWAITDVLAEAGLRSAFFSGDEGQKRRTQNIIELHDDPTLAVLLATDAGGVGLNLQRAASTMINIELPWNPAVLEQRIGRIYRLGQAHPVQIYNLVSEHGIEARIANLLNDKQALFSELFDGTSNELVFTGSGRFLDRVEQLVELPQTPELDEIDEIDEVEEQIDEVITPAAQPVHVAPETPGTPELPPLPVPATRPSAPRPPSGPAQPAQPAAPPAPASAAPVQGAQVQQLLASIQVQRTDQGGLKIEAPPEAAGTLAAMFQGMANLLATASAPGSPG